jgi:DGQHR domain-containing protein
MFALRMRQKDAEFYVVSYPAEKLLKKVRFMSRFYGERGEAVGGETKEHVDEIEMFIHAIEQSSGAFQRQLNRKKVRQIREFYRNVSDQPVIPGAVLLYTSEELKFAPRKGEERSGDLEEPEGNFLIIDGQHRLAGLLFYLGESDADKRVEVPCVIFDGKTAEFATEMFVIINSTQTRINKSHLVDLYGKISWGTDPEKKYAAALIQDLYAEPDSPLRYHVNMLGGRSTQEMWINQAQLFTEIHRFVTRKETGAFVRDERGWNRQKGYRYLRDFLRGVRAHGGEAWGDLKRSMLSRDVTLKAMVRVAGDAAGAWVGEMPEDRGELEEFFKERLAPLAGLVKEFRKDDFYERFPARGQAERVEVIRRRLDRELGIKV